MSNLSHVYIMAKGNNYWCILYPPLCMIDDNKSEEVKYDFKILELFKKIF